MWGSRQLRCFLYAAIAVVALYGTWSQNLHYFTDFSPATTVAAFIAFVIDIKANPATRSIGVDIMLFALAAMIWMVQEARRLGIRFVWLYILFAFSIAISVTFPLFLIAREARLAETGEPMTGTGLLPGDTLALLAAGGLIVWICWFLSVT